MDTLFEPYVGSPWDPSGAPDVADPYPIVAHGSSAAAIYLAVVDYQQTAVMMGGPPCLPLVVGSHMVGAAAAAITVRIVVPHYCDRAQVYYTAAGQGALFVIEDTETYAAQFRVEGKQTAAFGGRQRLKGSVDYDSPTGPINRALRFTGGSDPCYTHDLTIYATADAGATIAIYGVSLRPFRSTSAI